MRRADLFLRGVIVTKMIKIKSADIREALEDELDRKPKPVETERFRDFVEGDIYEFLKDNARSFVRDHINE